MPKESTSGHFREEVLNVKLSEILSRHATQSVPERIIERDSDRRRLPDIIAMDLWGIRVILEGKSEGGPAIEKTLDKKCKERIEEGLAVMSIGVIYPSGLRYASSFQDLDEKMTVARLKVKVFSEGEESGWLDANPGDLAQLLRQAYDTLVKEDIVENAVVELKDSIEKAIEKFACYPATEDRLRKILVVPRGEEDD